MDAKVANDFLDTEFIEIAITAVKLKRLMVSGSRSLTRTFLVPGPSRVYTNPDARVPGITIVG